MARKVNLSKVLLLVFLPLVMVLAGCGDPKKVVYHENGGDKALAQVFEKGKLTQEETELLTSCLLRAKLGGLFGTKVVKLEGMTIGEMIESQRAFVKSEKDAADAEKTAEAKRKEAAKAYFPKIKVSGIHVGEGQFGGIGAFGEVKNLGDQTLTEVEVTIYCLDKGGQPVFEKTYRPVLDSKLSFQNEGPLRPNYSRKFGCKLDDAPKEWNKKVRIEVTDVKFQ